MESGIWKGRQTSLIKPLFEKVWGLWKVKLRLYYFWCKVLMIRNLYSNTTKLENEKWERDMSRGWPSNFCFCKLSLNLMTKVLPVTSLFLSAKNSTTFSVYFLYSSHNKLLNMLLWFSECGGVSNLVNCNNGIFYIPCFFAILLSFVLERLQFHPGRFEKFLVYIH